MYSYFLTREEKKSIMFIAKYGWTHNCGKSITHYSRAAYQKTYIIAAKTAPAFAFFKNALILAFNSSGDEASRARMGSVIMFSAQLLNDKKL